MILTIMNLLKLFANFEGIYAKTKVTLIYWGLCLFIFLALIPWIFNPTLALHSIQALANIWRDCNCFFGRHYLGLGR